MLNIQKPSQRYIRAPKRVGGWLPNDPQQVLQWLKKIATAAKENPPRRSPLVQVLQDLVEKNGDLYMLFTEMLAEARSGVKVLGLKYIDNFTITDLPHLFDTLDTILLTAPSFTGGQDPQIGTPINALLIWPMATKAGFAVFLRKDVNLALKGILKQWGAFLKSPASCMTLNENEGGWFSKAAIHHDHHMANFAEVYVCDDKAPHYGYTSWDNFFTREFRPGQRPIAGVGDDSIIINAAESTYFSLQKDVQLVNEFWIKGQPYSLTHMMNGDKRAKDFVGGTVYQAFLSADSYHRWHAPVSGQIVDMEIVPGTYYSEPICYGFDPDSGPVDLDPGADEASQGYISAVAARGLIWIQADNPDIGLMCMVVIGMAEVSTIDVTMPPNTPFTKGEELGMFHFGGSSHCLVFGRDVKLSWKTSTKQSKINSHLAQVV